MSTEIVTLNLDWDLVNHLADPESVRVLRKEEITTDLVQDPRAAKVLEWQLEYIREHREPATASVLEDEFNYVAIDDPLSDIDDLINRLRVRYVRNEGRKVVEGLAETAVREPGEVGNMMVHEGRRIAALTNKKGEIFQAGDIDRALELYDKRVLQGRGPSFGFEEIDNHYHGQRGVVFFIGPPKGMKSWFTINALLANVMNKKKTRLYCLELPVDEADARLRCMASDVPFWRYLHGAMDDEHRARWREASELLDDLGSYEIVKPDAGSRQMEVMIDKAREDEVDCIFIDQLQYVENRYGVSIGEKNETGDYWGALNKARDYSDDGPIFIVHQFNRSIMNADEFPDMQQVKGSSAIEEVGSVALATWANKEMKASNMLELGTLYSRHEQPASWEVKVEFNRGCNFTIMGQN